MSVQFRIRIFTWNVSRSGPPEDLAELLGLDERERPNLIAIGLQELMPDTTLTFVNSISDNEWTKRIVSTLSPLGYVRVKALQMSGLQLSLYIDRSYMMSIREVECKFNSFKDFDDNFKEGVAIRLGCQWGNVCFVNSHIAYHCPYNLIRFYEDVLEVLRFRDPEIMNQDYLFWIGDFGFPLICKDKVRKKIKEGKYKELLLGDQLFQLNSETGEGNVFKNFKEGAISFPPTFNATLWEPEWTDRILWRALDSADVKQDTYTSHQQYQKSKHTPVTSSFTIELKDLFSSLSVMKFSVRPRWYKGKDQTFAFAMSEDSSSSTSDDDWIGIYPLNFKSFDEYVRRVCVPLVGEHIKDCIFLYSSCFPTRDLTNVPIGRYVLFYFNHFKDYVLGHSDEFEIVDQEQHDDDDDEEQLIKKLRDPLDEAYQEGSHLYFEGDCL